VIRRLGRMITLVALSVAVAAVANAVRPAGLKWYVSRIEVYPMADPGLKQYDITAEEVLRLSEQGTVHHDGLDRRVVIIDGRAEEKYRNGHIPGAINFPAHSAEEKAAELFQIADPMDFVIIYCGGGDCEESKQVFDVLKANGFPNLKLFLGGWQLWMDRHLPVAEGDP